MKDLIRLVQHTIEENKLSSYSPVGERNPSCKLTKKQVIEIRKLFDEGKMTKNELADKYNMARQTIHSIVKRTRWKHV